jgi:Ca-activated chloride channel family protein
VVSRMHRRVRSMSVLAAWLLGASCSLQAQIVEVPTPQPTMPVQTTTKPKPSAPVSMPTVPARLPSAPASTHASDTQEPANEAAPVVRKTPKPRLAIAPSSNDEEVYTPQTSHTKADANAMPTLHVQSRLVTVPVTVLNAGGAPVGGLTRDQFTLTDDGAPQKIALFERETTSPLSIVLAIDTSDTVLTNAKLEREAAKTFVKTLLRPKDLFDVMQFSDNVLELVSFTGDVKRIDDGLGRLQRGDQTQLFDAVYLASQRLEQESPDPARRRVIVLITDGGDSGIGIHYPQAIQQAQRAGATIYPIIIVPITADAGRDVGGEHALIQMAEDTGGKYVYVEDPKRLVEAFERISDDLRTQYVLGYYAPQRPATTDLHRIVVRVQDGALGPLTVRSRVGYYDQVAP